MSFYHLDPLSPFAPYMVDKSVESKLLAQGSEPLLEDLVNTVHFSVVAARLIGHKVNEDEINYYTYCALNQIPHHQVIETALKVKLNLDITFEHILAKKKFLGKCYIESFHDLDKNEMIVDRLSLIPYETPEEEKYLYDEIVYGSKYCVQTDNEFERYRHLFYTGTHILKNYLTLKDRRSLIEIEKILILSGSIEFWKQLQCLDKNLQWPRGFALLMTLSEFFYGTLYPCAGLLRTYVIPGSMEDDDQHGFGLNYLSFNALDLNLEKDLAQALKNRYRKLEHQELNGHQGYLGRALGLWHQIFKAKPLHMGNSLISFFYLKVIARSLGLSFNLEKALANPDLRKELDDWSSIYTYEEWSEEAYQALPLKDYLFYEKGFTLAIEERIIEKAIVKEGSFEEATVEVKKAEEATIETSKIQEATVEVTTAEEETQEAVPEVASEANSKQKLAKEKTLKGKVTEDYIAEERGKDSTEYSEYGDYHSKYSGINLTNSCSDDAFSYESKARYQDFLNFNGNSNSKLKQAKAYSKNSSTTLNKEKASSASTLDENKVKASAKETFKYSQKNSSKEPLKDFKKNSAHDSHRASQEEPLNKASNKEAGSFFPSEDYLNQETDHSQSIFTPVSLPYLLTSNKALVAELMEDAKAGLCSIKTHQVREYGFSEGEEVI